MPIHSLDFLNVSIESENLVVRSVLITDAPRVFQEFDSVVTRYMYPVPAKAIETTQNFIQNSLKGMAIRENLQFAITLKETGEFLGCAGLHEPHTPTPELGIWLKKSAHGKRWGQETIRAIVEWAKANGSFNYFIYPVHVENVPSRRIPESLAGVIAREYMGSNIEGKPHPLVEYHIPGNVL